MTGLARLFEGATMRDGLVAALDVLLVAFLIYRVLLLIKGTRAAYMAVGLVLIAAGFFAARELRLTTVSWLFDNLITYFILLVIVVFQHDIRRGLMGLGQNLFSFARTYEETHVFEEVVRACEQMARARMGALIVFERQADLSAFVETGHALDARVSKELLVSIFVPTRENVLHDGAAIIKALRLQQVGGVLPLSKRGGLDAALGTRHRAAIGITEETDAVCVVVSEERGEISLSFGGQLARELDGATLRKALLELFAKKRPFRKVAEEAEGALAAAEAVASIARAATSTPHARVGSVPPLPREPLTASDEDDDGKVGA